MIGKLHKMITKEYFFGEDVSTFKKRKKERAFFKWWKKMKRKGLHIKNSKLKKQTKFL